MRLPPSALVAGSLAVGIGGTIPPEVPWWGQLLMAIVATALAYFGGRGARE